MNKFEAIEQILKDTDVVLFNEIKNKYYGVDKIIKKELSPTMFGNIIYNCLKECISETEKKSGAFPNAKKFASRAHNFLNEILVNSPFEYFKEAVHAFEKIVNTKNINGDTPRPEGRGFFSD